MFPVFSCKGGLIIKTLKQLGIILTILFIGQALSQYFNLPMPGTVIGMIILLLLLLFKIVKLKWVNKITDILLEHLSILFVPSGVAIINEYHNLKGNILQLSIILVVTMIIVMAVTGKVVEILINYQKKERNYD